MLKRENPVWLVLVELLAPNGEPATVVVGLLMEVNRLEELLCPNRLLVWGCAVPKRFVLGCADGVPKMDVP